MNICICHMFLCSIFYMNRHFCRLTIGEHFLWNFYMKFYSCKFYGLKICYTDFYYRIWPVELV